MNKMADIYNGIGYLAATFKVDDTTKTYLKTNHTNPKTGNVDVNGMNLAVKLNDDNTVGLGQSVVTEADALFGIIIAYEMDGFATVQIGGGIDGVPTKAEITSGRQSLAANDKGQLEVVAEGGARDTSVVVGSESDNLFASIIL